MSVEATMSAEAQQREGGLRRRMLRLPNARSCFLPGETQQAVSLQIRQSFLNASRNRNIYAIKIPANITVVIDIGKEKTTKTENAVITARYIFTKFLFISATPPSQPQQKG